MKISFTPSPDVRVVLNAMLDSLERRNGTYHREAERSGPTIQHRSIKVTLAALPLPTYFSQTNPSPRLTANEQFSALEKNELIKLNWLPGETNHLLQSVTLTDQASHTTDLFQLLARVPTADNRSRLEGLLLADRFRFQNDWRARAINYVLNQLKAGRSPAPFSLTDSNLNLDLLAVLQALATLTTETPYRVFSVQAFNNSKRLEAIKHQLVSLARLGNPEWKRMSAGEVLRELNLVANPTYIHLAGSWQLSTGDGEILNLSGFTPSLGFPAAQISSLQSICTESALCIENLTTFHQYTRQTQNGTGDMKYAVLCTYGNPSPAVRRLVRLLPETTPIYLWSDMDYGGFNILAQLRKQVSLRVQPYLMDIVTFDKHAHLSHPLTQSDARNLKRLLFNPILEDIHPVIEHLLQQGLKLEQEAIQI